MKKAKRAMKEQAKVSVTLGVDVERGLRDIIARESDEAGARVFVSGVVRYALGAEYPELRAAIEAFERREIEWPAARKTRKAAT